VAAVAALVATDASAFQPGAGTLAALGIAPSVPEAPAVAVRPGRGQAGQPANAPTTFGAPANVPTTVQTVLSPVAFDVRGRFDTIADPGVSRDEMAQAVPNRPDVLVALRQAGAAAANTLLAEAARSRDVTVGASWNRTRLPQNLPQVQNAQPYANNQFALSLSIPIFTRPIVEGNLAVAAAQQAQVEAQARQVLFQARADFAGAWAGYEQARALLGLYSGGAVARAEEAYASSERAYLAGGRSLLDVMDALRTLNGTRTAANNARYAYLVALATLEQATGISGITPRL
jgi:outer membrane protein TolC